jgi:antitoxin component YwqK of YwqJK toxin-antitoxin module
MNSLFPNAKINYVIVETPLRVGKWRFYNHNGELNSIKLYNSKGELKTIFEDGKLLVDLTLAAIRKRLET